MNHGEKYKDLDISPSDWVIEDMESNYNRVVSNDNFLNNFEILKPKELTLNEYQKLAAKSMLPQCRNINYLGLGLAGETGELCDKLKRIIRGDGKIDDALLFELSDILWYLSQLALFFHVDFNKIGLMNIEKLEKRMEAGKIAGQGDKR
jgi:NTP pyrophosphatase (non-canonical NTP hydrolase)